ncbi:guanine nucleotide-binding protein subunit gamma [Octopus bimaculoides]|uniref:G protein gamma domain-containing protein n=1 Tax=Octopus bimaculoides TaxID=37653 RepID=A0A0L8GZF7_OCTBM|nr:guanine nucleotide-binding protein subunit gamma [Octopus bimaculoides]|eukprot:XP_014776860.1 PREDICTED: guanine nucleotide-binding protein subunit gamma-like [Octopus bimaculoides]
MGGPGGKKPPKDPDEEEDDPMNNPELVKIIIGQFKYQLKMDRMMVSESIKLHMEKIDEKIKTDYMIHSAPKSENIWIDSGNKSSGCLVL